MRRGTPMSAEARARVSAATKAAMDNPIVRQRIRDGMKGAAGVRAEAAHLRAAWSAARPSVRRDFLASILSTESRERADG